jgi:hypothetical protein
MPTLAFRCTSCCLEGPSSIALGTGVRSDDLHATPEAPTMGITFPTVSSGHSVDATGRALPMTDEEIRARASEIARGLDALDDMGDEEEQRQTLEALMKAIDEEPLSARKRFRP